MDGAVIFLVLLLVIGFVIVFWGQIRISIKIDAIDRRLASWEHDINEWVQENGCDSRNTPSARAHYPMPSVGNDEDFHRE